LGRIGFFFFFCFFGDGLNFFQGDLNFFGLGLNFLGTRLNFFWEGIKIGLEKYCFGGVIFSGNLVVEGI